VGESERKETRLIQSSTLGKGQCRGIPFSRKKRNSKI
jgi:hypothetical protein